MPTSFGRMFQFVLSSLLVTIVGIFILSRTPIWPLLVGQMNGITKTNFV